MTHTSLFKIFFISVVTFLFTPAVSFAATLQVLPVTVSVNAGEAFTQTIFVSSADQALNAISGTITFPTNLLSVASLSHNNSILSLWVQQPKFSNTSGTVKWSGVLPNPGFTGSRGKVFSIRFVAKRSGLATIGFSSSTVLANNGIGTDILKNTGKSSISITPSISQSAKQSMIAHITSSTHPNQTKWYALSKVILDWTNAQKVTAVRLGYDQNANGLPSIFYSKPISHKELRLDDGIWYFHVQERTREGWGPVNTFRIQIDTVPPLPIQLLFPNSTTTATTTIAVQFGTTDALSGIDHYVLSVDGHNTVVSAKNGNGVYALPVGDIGEHTLSVIAYDKAGNSVRAQGKFNSTMKRVTSLSTSPVLLVWLVINYLSLLLLIIAMVAIVAFVSWYLWHHFHIFRKRMRQQIDPAQQLLHEQFTEVNEAIVKEVLSLEKVRTERDLTKEEEQIIMNLREVLVKAEVSLSKEMSTMEHPKKEDM